MGWVGPPPDVPSPGRARREGSPRPHHGSASPRGRAAPDPARAVGRSGRRRAEALAPATGGKLQASPDPELPPPRPSHPPLPMPPRQPGRRRRHYHRRQLGPGARRHRAPPLRESSALPRAYVSASLPLPGRRPLAVPQPPGRATRPRADLGRLPGAGGLGDGGRGCTRAHTPARARRLSPSACRRRRCGADSGQPLPPRWTGAAQPVPRSPGAGEFPAPRPSDCPHRPETPPAACPRLTSAAFPVPRGCGRRPRVGRPQFVVPKRWQVS